MNRFFKTPAIRLTIVIEVNFVGRAHHHDLVAFFPSIDHVQQISWLGVEPAYFMRLAIARHNAKSGGLRAIKFNFVTTRFECFRIGSKREVMQDGEVFGDGHVVRQTGARQINVNLVTQFAIGADHAILHVRRFQAVVEKDQLASVRVRS